MQQDLYAREVKMRGSKMLDFLVLHFVTCLCNAISTQSDDFSVRMPPCITKSHPEKSTVYERRQTLSLECSAVGTPAVRYEWRKNGFPLNTTLSRISIESDGAITINRATETDEGHYQCFAKNRYGTALSNMIDVRMAFLDSTAGPPTVHRKTVVEGRPFYIQADRDRSFPLPRYYWSKAQDVNRIFTPLLPSKRIQMAENGDLHFAHALRDDDHGDKIYSCTIFNPYLDIDTRGCYTQLTVTRNSTGTSRFAPILAFSSTTETVALTGENVTLRCFFYGNPEPTISWIRPAKPVGKYSLSTYDKELTINSVTASDEGEFICTGSNSKGTIEHSLHIRVEAKPEFKNAMDGPCNVNITEEESVTFNCNASAKPEAMIVWLQNGQPINTDNPPERFVFSNDNKTLEIRNVCRDCVDQERQTDLMVIQCNASNVHGYVFGQGCVNVLKKTNVTISGPGNVQVNFLVENRFIFWCRVTSDPSTPSTVRWYKTEEFGDMDLVLDELPHILVTNGALIIATTANCYPDCAKYLGEYRCVGNNGYSQDHKTITLSRQTETSLENITKNVFTDNITRNVFSHDITKSVFTEDITKSVFAEDITKNVYTEDTLMNKATWAMWEIILFVAAIGLVLFLIGIFLDYRWKRRFGAVKRETIERRLPNPASIYEDIGYDSIGLPLEDTALSNEKSIRRESGEYERIGYDSVDKLDEIENRDDAMTNTSDANELSRYESLDAPQRETNGRGKPMLDNDVTSEKIGYFMPLEEVTYGGGIDQQQFNGYESVQSESDEFSKSIHQPESANSYSDLKREEVNLNLDIGKGDFKPKLNSHSTLASKEIKQNLDLEPNEVNQYSDLEPNEVNQYLDLEPNEVNQYLDLESNEVNQYLDLEPNEVNQYSDLEPNEVNQYLDLEPNEVNQYLDLEPNEVNQYLDLAPNEVNQNLNLESNEVNQYLNLEPNEVNQILEQEPESREK